MNKCSDLIMSEEYMDFIINTDFVSGRSFDKSFIKNGDSSESCVVKIDDMWSAGYGLLSDDLNLSVSSIGYQTIPKLYGLSDTGAVNAAGISQVLAQPAFKADGEGVILGFIDTGINYDLDVFKDYTGQTRIMAIWDQTFVENTSQTDMNMSEGKATGVKKQDNEENDFAAYVKKAVRYGRVYTRNEINEAIKMGKAGKDKYEIVAEKDTNGHGTYMAGVAAGSDLSMYADAENTYTGASPNADIVVVKLKEAKKYLKDYFLVSQEKIAYEETDIMLGASFLRDISDYLGKPLVICVGVGTGNGPRTGATPLAMLLSNIAGRMNTAVITSMGNEASDRNHVSGKAGLQGSPYVLELYTSGDSDGFCFELWADTLDVLSVSIVSPSGESTARIPAKQGNTVNFGFIIENTTIQVDYQVVESLSGYEMIFFRMLKPAEGIWKFNIYSITGTNGGFNAWLPLKVFITGNIYFLKSSPDITLTEPAASSYLISVGSYNYITMVPSVDSGRGYTALNGVKPDILSPGVNVAGPGIDGNVVLRSGTSAAAAIAAGAAADIMTWAVTYGNEKLIGNNDIRYIMIRGCKRNVDTLYPNPVYGYGILDLFNSFLQIRIT